MVIFDSYVELPKGKPSLLWGQILTNDQLNKSLLLVSVAQQLRNMWPNEQDPAKVSAMQGECIDMSTVSHV